MQVCHPKVIRVADSFVVTIEGKHKLSKMLASFRFHVSFPMERE